MKVSQEIKELRLKPASELHKLLSDSREQLRDLRFKASQNQLKEVHKIKEVRTRIAHILTALNENQKDDTTTNQ